jgi:hypothetical protein
MSLVVWCGGCYGFYILLAISRVPALSLALRQLRPGHRGDNVYVTLWGMVQHWSFCKS